ncbi:MAG TPA: 23S rRNA pseudouridine(2604) synthase RluF [Solimonas sp.]|nr:23S rRNA pseudouridine(2604) synthase RluF [Solimonas sp.]
MWRQLRMRLNKFISETGICSRREADGWIESGRVQINGKPAELGTQVGEGDEVSVDGKAIGRREQAHVYIALNKPVGIVCTTDRAERGNIVDFINHPQRIFPIGRLDKDSEGLILLTSNGDIVNELLRSENNHEKEYVVRVDQPVSARLTAGMAGGVHLPELGETTKPCKVTAVDAHTLRIVLTQGLNRQIRRMCKVFGYEVRRLQRVRFVNIRLGGLKPGQWRDLELHELRTLLPHRAESFARPAAPRS